MQTYYTEHIELILIFGVIAFFFHRIALSRKFYFLTEGPPTYIAQISLVHVLLGFAIYITGSLLLPEQILPLISPLFSSKSTAITWASLFSLGTVFLLLCGLYLLIMKKDFLIIWKNSPEPLIKDAVIGVLTWFLAFPFVAIVEQVADLFTYSLFGLKTYEQVAVQYLKSAMNNPHQLIAALFLILVIAPLLEELLFRGLLQSFIKKHLGAKAAILLAALGFALLHVSSIQGFGNISLVLSLLTFSYFLGLVYEKRQSLIAPIALHFTFNAFTTLRILFFMDV